MARKNIVFPQVLRNEKLKECVIIYRNRSEYYGPNGLDVYNGSIDETYDPYKELDMNLHSGFKFVHQGEYCSDKRDAYVQELETKITKMQEQCPEGGCLVEEE